MTGSRPKTRSRASVQAEDFCLQPVTVALRLSRTITWATAAAATVQGGRSALLRVSASSVTVQPDAAELQSVSSPPHKQVTTRPRGSL
jgi:hypothetical protein